MGLSILNMDFCVSHFDRNIIIMKMDMDMEMLMLFLVDAKGAEWDFHVFCFVDVKVTQFGDIVEARTVQQSSILCLVDTYESIHSEGFHSSFFCCI